MRKDRFLVLSVFMLFISSAMLFLTTFSDFQKDGIIKFISFSITLLFWLGVILGYTFMIVFYVKTKKPKGIAGIVLFFTNKYAAIADCMLIASVVLTVAFTLLNVYSNIIYSLLISVFFLSLNLHAVLNGKVFRHKFLKEEMKK